jgi:SPP1 gp7 family putative phage head morphogenesis protein
MARRPAPTPVPPMPSDELLRRIGAHDWEGADRQALKERADRIEKELREARDRLLPAVPEGAFLTTNRGILDMAVRRRIALERYSSFQLSRMVELLHATSDDIADRITLLRSRMGADATKSIAYDKLIGLKASVDKLITDTNQYITGLLRGSLVGTAGSYNAHVGGLLEALSTDEGGARIALQTQRITVEQAMAAANARPMQGALLEDWLTHFSDTARDRIDETLRIAFIEGEAANVTKQRLRAVTQQTSRGLDALIRTSHAHIATAVTEANYAANADLIEGVEWVSVLDSRTTAVCRSRDGKRWPVGEGPRPPAHVNCRSTVIPALIGTQPAGRETYGQWLKRQSAATQDDILGPARGKLFRSGKITVDRFVDMKGKRIPLNELRT